MSRKVADCRKWPSESGCTLTISGEEDEVIAAATHHAMKDCSRTSGRRRGARLAAREPGGRRGYWVSAPGESVELEITRHATGRTPLFRRPWYGVRQGKDGVADFATKLASLSDSPLGWRAPGRRWTTRSKSSPCGSQQHLATALVLRFEGDRLRCRIAATRCCTPRRFRPNDHRPKCESNRQGRHVQ